MLPIRHQSIFKSRWIALLWAGGIIWSAVEFTGSQPTPDATNNQSSPDAGQADNASAASDAAVQSAMNAIQALK
jgi:hypothetical protein